MSRVLLAYHSPLFAYSVRLALMAQPQIVLVGEIVDWAGAEEEIRRLAPDVVIVEEDERLATEAILSLLLEQTSSWRVVALQLGETAMHIWSGAWQPINRADDLISAVGI